jgi:hypothetical protein
MRRLQFFIDETVDDRLEAEAARTGTSKAELIRAAIDARYAERDTPTGDPIDALVGAFDGPPRVGETIDDVVYGS